MALFIPCFAFGSGGSICQNDKVNKNAQSVPFCPDSGSTLLDDTYPAQAYVISNSSYENNLDEVTTSAKFISIILSTHSTTTGFPEIIVPSSSNTSFETLISQTEADLKKRGYQDSYIKKLISNIKMADAESYTWQQDYFEAFVDLDTGMPLLRQVESYSRVKGDYLDRVNDVLSCAKKGDNLKSYKAPLSWSKAAGDISWGNGEMGGNIEGLPGGLCLTGNNQGTDYAKQYCGDINNIVMVDVGWLEVGHVDELIKVVPRIPKVEPLECNFSIMLASPEAALEALSEPNNRNRPFIDTNRDIDKYVDDLLDSKSGKFLCNAIEDYLKTHSDSIEKENKSQDADVKRVRNSYFKYFYSLFIPDVYAGSIVTKTKDNSCRDFLKKASNKTMLEVFNSYKKFTDTNNLVEKQMKEAKERIEKKLLERMPQCGGVNFLKAPDLFYNDFFAEIDGKLELPKDGHVGSLFPNPTNSVLSNETIILPETPSRALNEKTQKLLKDQGLQSELIDTWNYAHKLDGNIHCASHSIPYCRPRK